MPPKLIVVVVLAIVGVVVRVVAGGVVVVIVAVGMIVWSSIETQPGLSAFLFFVMGLFWDRQDRWDSQDYPMPKVLVVMRWPNCSYFHEI
jgi:hypothetical protein